MPNTSYRCGRVAIVGRPNVGKSTLLNRLVGQKLAITSHKPQTTRHTLLGIKTRPEGQILYLDTPGIHQRGDKALNRYLNRTARSALNEVELILFLVEEKDLAKAGIPCIAVVTKIDRLVDKTRLLPFLQALLQRHPFLELIPVSARKNTQIEVLEQRILAALPEGPAFYPEDQLSDRPERFFAAELLREQLTRRYAQELPYQLSVEIERFEEEPGLYRIHALIWVERPSQQGILIGKGGLALKETAQAARIAMERFFDCKVYLEVWVKVKESWSSDEQALGRLGYGEP
jgi:GTP-binding protein Era